MQSMAAGARRTRGFSLIELLVVVGIIMVVAAMALPNIMTAMDNVRMHSAMRDVIGLMQQARQTAVKDNRFYTLRQNPNDRNTIFVDFSNDGFLQSNAVAGPPVQPPEPAVQLPARLTYQAGGFPVFNNALVGANFVPQAAWPSFNARGLPCVVQGVACNSHAGAVNPGQSGASVNYICYFSEQRTFGPVAWSAITVSSAGRMKAWFYDTATGRWSD